MVGTLSLGLSRYPVAQALTGTHAMLAVYAIVIGVAAMILGFIGRYVLRMNWMMLSGAVCGVMTNTSLAAVDATKSEYPSIGYAATYPFAAVMMVVTRSSFKDWPEEPPAIERAGVLADWRVTTVKTKSC